MSAVFCIKLKPTSPWRTPWHADTLAGLLLATAVRTLGSDAVRERLIAPMLDGHPPFVVTDALPGDLLPFPVHLRLANWPEGTPLKKLKKARWIAPGPFELARNGQRPPIESLLADSDLFLCETRQHNSLDRTTDASFTAEQGGGIFQRPDLLLKTSHAHDYLSVYFRLFDRSVADLLLELFHQLSLTGFGADIATGRGQFDILGDAQPMPHLDQIPPGANGVLSLSTFQPGPADPIDGYWDAFPKFGKLGPDVGTGDVRKNTLILMRPGACFETDPTRRWLGRAIPMQEFLQKSSVDQLTARGMALIHPVFALVVPAVVLQEG